MRVPVTCLMMVFFIISNSILSALEVETVSNSIVRVRVYENNRVAMEGAGFVVSEQGKVLTNAHLVKGADRITVVSLKTGAEILAQREYADRDANLALLQVNGLGLPPLGLSEQGAGVGRIVYTLTFGAGNEVQLSQGTIGAYHDMPAQRPDAVEVRLLRHNAMITSAEFGMPLFNECSQVVAINLPDPNTGRWPFRRVKEPDGTVSALRIGDMIARLNEWEISHTVVEEACLSAVERAEQSAREKEELAEAAEVEKQAAEEDRLRQAEEKARQAELERQRVAQEIERYWQSFETALEQGEWDRAEDRLNRVQELDPDAPGLADAARRLSQAREAARKALEYAGEMVAIPAGSFRMGDISGAGDDDQRPVHTVTLRPFRMGKYEVTVGQFRRFVEATGYRTDAERNADGNQGCAVYTGAGEVWEYTAGTGWRNPGFSVGDEHPVVCVSWNDAQEYIDWLTSNTGGDYRFPTEAEWEYAVRAGSTTEYHFGNDESQLCRYANHADSRTDFSWKNESCPDGVGKRTAEVGRYRPNSFGLHDMHGNVWEWVEDCWNDSYAGAPTDGRAWTLGDCGLRVIRGGSWNDEPWLLRSAFRDGYTRSDRFDSQGFRLAQDN